MKESVRERKHYPQEDHPNQPQTQHLAVCQSSRELSGLLRMEPIESTDIGIELRYQESCSDGRAFHHKTNLSLIRQALLQSATLCLTLHLSAWPCASVPQQPHSTAVCLALCLTVSHIKEDIAVL